MVNKKSTQPVLPQSFYARDTVTVARELLGMRLVAAHNGRRIAGIISETEAYLGLDDTACHAHKGRTPRTDIMFGPAGYAYVYLCYGLHYLFNIVTQSANIPEAVLVRAILPREGLDQMQTRRGAKISVANLANGPAKLCQALGIAKDTHNGLDLTLRRALWLEPGEVIDPAQIENTPRIGINYAEPADVAARLRFVLPQNLC